MTDYTAVAIEALSAPGRKITDPTLTLSGGGGLYAVHGDAAAREALGAAGFDRHVALYVGKSETSLPTRDLVAHFAIDPERPARTGGSTLRRSIAALLRDQLDLTGVPRNVNKPGYFASYGLDPDADLRLTRWMHDNLTLAFWEAPADLSVPLGVVEREVIEELQPPLNLAHVREPWAELRLARQAMAAEARAYT